MTTCNPHHHDCFGLIDLEEEEFIVNCNNNMGAAISSLLPQFDDIDDEEVVIDETITQEQQQQTSSCKNEKGLPLNSDEALLTIREGGEVLKEWTMHIKS